MIISIIVYSILTIFVLATIFAFIYYLRKANMYKREHDNCKDDSRKIDE